MTTPIAVLLMAYGTPRTRDEILPYYTDIRRGRPPTPEQLGDLLNRYEAIGGISPLAQRTEAQRDALQAALDQQAPGQYMVTLGLKHAAPMIETAVNDLAALGVTRIIGLVLAPHFSSYSIGQYHGRASAAAEPHGIAFDGIDSWATEPAFVKFLADDLRELGDVLADHGGEVLGRHAARIEPEFLQPLHHLGRAQGLGDLGVDPHVDVLRQSCRGEHGLP